MFKFKYNEKAYAEELLKNGFSTNHINNDLRILAKYFKECGNKPKERENLLYKFCEEQLEGFNKVEYFKRINSALNYVKKKENKLIVVNEIHITNEELKLIDDFDLDYTYKKVLFTLLVLNKLNKAVQLIKYEEIKNTENYFGGNDKNYKELIESSKILLSKRNGKQSIHNIIGDLDKKGIVEIRSKGFIKLSFLYDISDCDDVEVVITNFCDIGYYYDLHTGQNGVKKCECCNVPIKVKSNRKKYCDECFKNHRNEYQKELMKKRRNVN